MSTRALAYRSLYKVRRLAVRTRPEVKTHEISVSGTTLSLSGIAVPLLSGANVIANGTESSERVGKKIRVLTIRIRYKISWYPGTPGVGNMVIVRASLVKRYHPNGHTDPSYASVFEGSTVNSFINQQSVHEYGLLRDRIHKFTDDNQVVTSSMTKYVGAITEYNIGDGAEKNSYHFMLNYDAHHNSGTPPAPLIDYEVLLTYTDV